MIKNGFLAGDGGLWEIKMTKDVSGFYIVNELDLLCSKIVAFSVLLQGGAIACISIKHLLLQQVTRLSHFSWGQSWLVWKSHTSILKTVRDKRNMSEFKVLLKE